VAGQTVENLLNDLSLVDPDRYTLALAACEAIRSALPGASEKVMYGGIMFSAPAMLCGVFAYSAHVSVEFGQGHALDDRYAVLEGQGKQRRHIKLHSLTDIQAKHLAEYVLQAAERVRQA
jgi:hypothetical protein